MDLSKDKQEFFEKMEDGSFYTTYTGDLLRVWDWIEALVERKVRQEKELRRAAVALVNDSLHIHDDGFDKLTSDKEE